MESLINKIKQRGYWKVIIRPTEFKEKRITTREECAKIIKESHISLRGWSYPHISREGIVFSGNDSVASSTDWDEGGHHEYWQFYQNGQFIHYFSMYEDSILKDEKLEKIKKSFGFSKPEDLSDRFLSILNTLYSVTEIFLFATNLVKKTDLGEKIYIEIELGNIYGRTLFFWDTFSRILFKAYTCKFHSENIVKKTPVKKDDLITSYTQLALDTTIEIFKDFNWKDVNKSIFVEDQKKLLERRL